MRGYGLWISHRPAGTPSPQPSPQMGRGSPTEPVAPVCINITETRSNDREDDGSRPQGASRHMCGRCRIHSASRYIRKQKNQRGMPICPAGRRKRFKHQRNFASSDFDSKPSRARDSRSKTGSRRARLVRESIGFSRCYAIGRPPTGDAKPLALSTVKPRPAAILPGKDFASVSVKLLPSGQHIERSRVFLPFGQPKRTASAEGH